MTYNAWSVVFGELPTAAKWNQLGTNDSGFKDGTNFDDSIVLPKHLMTGAGSSWAWQSWTPTLTNITLGNGTITYAKYTQIGKLVHYRIRIVVGSTTTATDPPTISVPVTVNGDYSDLVAGFGTGAFYDASSGAVYQLTVLYRTSGTGLSFGVLAAGGTYGTFSGATSAAIPVAWASGDNIFLAGTFEAA